MSDKGYRLWEIDMIGGPSILIRAKDVSEALGKLKDYIDENSLAVDVYEIGIEATSDKKYIS